MRNNNQFINQSTNQLQVTTAILAEICAEIFPPGVVSILTGGNELGKWIVEHPLIKHVSFTGSVSTGKVRDSCVCVCVCARACAFGL